MAKVETTKGEAFILRTCAADMTSHGGFQWPREGFVSAPDWEATDTCGNGLHGFLWGEGRGDLADWSVDAVWVVAKITEWIDLDGKVKFPSAEVVFAGDRHGATAKLAELGARGPVVGGTATAGVRGTANAGVGGTLHVRWWGGAANRYRTAVGYVGEDGILPGVSYRVQAGKFIAVPASEQVA